MYKEPTDKMQFEDFLMKKWKTWVVENERNGDSVLSKAFVKNGEEYFITARFSKSENYCYGYVTDTNGEAIINGRGFSLEEFLEFFYFI